MGDPITLFGTPIVLTGIFFLALYLLDKYTGTWHKSH